MRAFRTAAFLTLAPSPAILALPAAAQTSGPPAQPNPTPDPDFTGDTVTVGVAAVNLPDYEGSNDYRWTPAPAAIGNYKGFAFQVLGNRASVDLIRNPNNNSIDIQAGPIGVVNFNRSNIDNIDDRRVRALGERDTAIELGGYIGVGKTGVITSPYDKISVSLSYRHDVSGKHDSGIWQPSINYLTPLSRRNAVALFASAEHVNRDYGRYYYDITPVGSAASGLPQFRARGGWKSYSLGIAGMQSLTGDLLRGLKAVGGVTYSRMLNDYGDSPIVSIAGSRNQWLGAVGLAYTF